MRMRLSKRSVDRARYQGSGGDYRWDTELAGFGVRVYSSGRKAFVITYRARGRQRFHTIGRFGPMTVEAARRRALTLLGRVSDGEDPAAERSGHRRAPTLTDLGRRYLDEHARVQMKASSYKQAVRCWEKLIRPRLGDRKVAHVTRADIVELMASMAETPSQANYTRGVLHTAFNLAEVWGWRPEGSNPCRHVKRFKLDCRESSGSTTTPTSSPDKSPGATGRG